MASSLILLILYSSAVLVLHVAKTVFSAELSEFVYTSSGNHKETVGYRFNRVKRDDNQINQEAMIQTRILSPNFQYLPKGYEINKKLTERGAPLSQEVNVVRKTLGDISINSIENSENIKGKRNSEKRKASGAPVTAEVEVLVILDYIKYKEFNGVRKDILDYVGIYFNGVNHMYGGIPDPKITFSIVGVISMTSTAEQPFIENGKSPDGKVYDLEKININLGSWVFANKGTLPKHDLVHLLTGVDGYAIQDGVYTQMSGGKAYFQGVCDHNFGGSSSAAVSVAEDAGRHFEGIQSTVHELAHTLGAPHDGEGDAKDCSSQDGYIMSYIVKNSPNRFFFSNCSIKLMKEHIASKGQCLSKVDNKERIPLSKDLPGFYLNMTEMCKIKTKFQTAGVANSMSTSKELCNNLMCTFQDPGHPGMLAVIIAGPPLEGSPCGTGGQCMKGMCDGDTSANLLPGERVNIDAYCKQRTGSPTATAETRGRTPKQTCGDLRCTFNQQKKTPDVLVGPALDGHLCGNGGKCKNGDCYGEKPK